MTILTVSLSSKKINFISHENKLYYMKAKLLIVLPFILSVGILLGYLVQVLAFSSTALNPGHPASEIGGSADSDRIFPNAMYTFPGDLVMSGSVGIGTTSPMSKFDVRNPSGTDLQFIGSFRNLNNAANNNGLSVNIARSLSDAFALNVISGAISRLYVGGDGNVGIGTTGPTAKLDVSGDVRISGDLNVGGNIKGIKFATKIAEVWNKKLSPNYPSGGPLFTVTPDEGHTTLILERTSWDINNADYAYDKYWARITFTDGTTRDEDTQSGSSNPAAQTHDDILIHGADYYKLWGNNKAVAKWEVWGIVIGSNTILSVEFHGWQV
jgi:hypothetical protein